MCIGRSGLFLGAIGLALFVGSPVVAYTVTIASGAPRELYLQVGDGAYSGTYVTGGVPGANPTVNTVTVVLTATDVGNGVGQAMTSNSTAATSYYDGSLRCNAPDQVYIGGWFRHNGQGGGLRATLSVTAPASLTSGANAIPISQISWTSTAIGDLASDIPSGTFSGGTQAIASIRANTWVEKCLAFRYADTVLPAVGTYTARAVYTLSQP